MSIPTNPAMPSWQNNVYPPFSPYSLDPSQVLATMQNTALTSNIYDSTNKIVGTLNQTERNLTQELSGINKNIYDTIAQNAVAIERTSANGMATTERVNSQLATAVERNGSNGINTTERTSGQVASAVERNAGNIMTAIEKVAGEGRLTTTITDAASRQASNDSARDILAAVERNGGASVGASKDAYNGLLASIERNSGENRMTTVTVDGASQARLADVRRDITSNLAALEGEVLSTFNKGHGDLITAIGNTAWETRQNQNTQYAALLNELNKSSAANSLQTAQSYASTMLEAQKTAALLSKQQDNQFAALVSKQDGHYSTIMLDNQKLFAITNSKQDNQFAAILLEQQKAKECITLQLQEAKYEALKNKQELSKELAECCCEIKMKVDQRTQDVIGTVDTLDRNRLRDDLNVANNENNVLKILDWYDDRGYDRGHHHHRGSRRRSGSRR